MIGIYFSGTGNSRYAAEYFINLATTEKSNVFSIEDEKVIEKIKSSELLIFSYPVQFSSVPKFLQDFIIKNKKLWNGKKIFIIATMGLFSGDGSGILGRLLKKYGAKIIGGLHLKMPDSICDEKLLKRSFNENVKLIKKAESKIKHAVKCLNAGKPTKEGLGLLCQIAGLLGQRLYFGYNTKHYCNKLFINPEKCIICGKCEKLCPTANIKFVNKIAIHYNRCTMCYRCLNNCPKQAITLLGKKVVEQSTVEKFLSL